MFQYGEFGALIHNLECDIGNRKLFADITINRSTMGRAVDPIFNKVRYRSGGDSMSNQHNALANIASSSPFMAVTSAENNTTLLHAQGATLKRKKNNIIQNIFEYLFVRPHNVASPENGANILKQQEKIVRKQSRIAEIQFDKSPIVGTMIVSLYDPAENIDPIFVRKEKPSEIKAETLKEKIVNWLLLKPFWFFVGAAF